MSFGQILLRTKVVHVTRKKAAETTFVRKIRAFNVDEIDGLMKLSAEHILNKSRF